LLYLKTQPLLCKIAELERYLFERKINGITIPNRKIYADARHSSSKGGAGRGGFRGFAGRGISVRSLFRRES
jgi:hypothetical protein